MATCFDCAYLLKHSPEYSLICIPLWCPSLLSVYFLACFLVISYRIWLESFLYVSRNYFEFCHPPFLVHKGISVRLCIFSWICSLNFNLSEGSTIISFLQVWLINLFGVSCPFFSKASLDMKSPDSFYCYFTLLSLTCASYVWCFSKAINQHNL